MPDARVLVTGFGAFEDVEDNPSGRLAAEIDGHVLDGGPGRGASTAPDGERGVRVVGAALPVSFERAPAALEALVAEHRPELVLSIGVHKGTCLRLERGARAELAPGRPDADGVDAAHLPRRDAPWIATSFDLGRIRPILAFRSGRQVDVSSDAGRYVCECIYRSALEWGTRTRRPSLFLHVPAFRHISLERQTDALRALLVDLLQQARAGA